MGLVGHANSRQDPAIVVTVASRERYNRRVCLTVRLASIVVGGLLAIAAQPAWNARMPWGDPDLHGEWTTEGEYGVPLERPAQYGTRQFLTDEEYAKRMQDIRARDEQDLEPVDVLSGRVQGAGAPIPHWREYNTTSRRTSLVIDPVDGRLPPRTPQAAPLAVQRCGSLLGGEPCDSYDEYGVGVRCIVHGGGLPDPMIPAVYNANMRIMQGPGYVAITYELIHDTRIIPVGVPAQHRLLSPRIRTYMGDSRGRWDGTTLVVDTSNLKANTRGSSPALRLTERFTRTARDAMQYQVTFVDPATWAAPWTAALDMKSRPDTAGVFEYACHEGNHGMSNMLSAARAMERTARRR
jgi:hypothetical protein